MAVAALVQLTGGSFQDAEGNPLSNGFLVWTLSHDMTQSITLPAQVVAGIRTKIYLDNNGNVAGNQYIWPNLSIPPTLLGNSTYYTVEAYNNKGLKVWAAQQYWTIPAIGPINLSTLVTLNP